MTTRRRQIAALVLAFVASGIGTRSADAATHTLRWRVHQLEIQMNQRIAYDAENEARALSEQAIVHNCWFGQHASLDSAGVFHLDPNGPYLVVTMSPLCLAMNGGVKDPGQLRGAAGRIR